MHVLAGNIIARQYLPKVYSLQGRKEILLSVLIQLINKARKFTANL